MKSRLRAAVVAACAALWAAPPSAQEEQPLSAIDWLSQSVESAAAAGGGVAPALPPAGEPPVADSAATPEISVRPLDGPRADGLGLLPPSVTGLPATLWAASPQDVVTLLVQAGSTDTLPALRELFVTLLLAEAAPPLPTGTPGSFFTARVDRLLDLGAIEPAQALLELADRDDPEIFRRWFDVTLLTGTEDSACLFMEQRPALTPTYPARVFCLARRGDWNAAALTLGTARALGAISAEEDALLARFLDPELFEGEAPLPPPARPTPLIYRLHEAIGEPIPTAGLPRAFAHADLRPVAAWRVQLEAAERLARVGAIAPNRLFDLYRSQTPAASGGIWDRAAAIQALEAALGSGPDAVAAALPAAWAAVAVPHAEVAFATHYGERLLAAGLRGEAAALAWRIALLSPVYEQAALAGVPAGGDHAVLAAIARGQTQGIPAGDARQGAVLAGFADAVPPERMMALLDEGRLGEAILRTLGAMAAGLDSDPQAMTDGIAFLRAVGLEDTARRAALQYLILARAE